MKKNLLCIIICCSVNGVSFLHAQNPVPNPGFENWTAGNPDNWLTLNSPGFAVPITQTTPAHSGTLAVKGEVVNTIGGVFPPLLISSDMNGNGFPVSQQYGTFSFYYKFNQVGTAVFYGIAAFTDASGNGVGSAGGAGIASSSSYTLASFPVYYQGGTADTCIIEFLISDSVAANPALGNYFVVDDVLLSGTAGIEEHHALTYTIEKVQPNPASNVSFIYYSVPTSTDIKFELFDVNGKKFNELFLINETAGRHKVELDVSGVPSGFYILRMISDSGTSTSRLQVVKK